MDVSLQAESKQWMYIFEIVIKGIIIGILVSAPMGPIGMLCVQRTLSRGRWHGFVSGMGAMLSDVVYATITLAGMSVANDFLTANEKFLQLVGSIVLIFFGVAVYRKNPLKSWSPNVHNHDTRYIKDFLSSFFLTLSNFAIIFVFITLFARFQFNPMDYETKLIPLHIVSVAIGALIWWFFISTFVSKIRKHFNRRGIVLLNRIVGVLLILIGIIGVIYQL